MHQRQGDLRVNVCKRKAATNIRSATKEATTVLNEPLPLDLDSALEYIVDGELVEVRLVAGHSKVVLCMGSSLLGHFSP